MPDSSDVDILGQNAHKPKPQYQPKQWDGNHHVPDGHGTYKNSDPVQAPSVPEAPSRSGKTTSVDTTSMESFASNIETLIPYVQRARSALQKVTVAPGAFYHANVLRDKVSGNNGGAGIKEGYSKALNDLANGLTDLCSGIRQMSHEYKTIEAANKMSSSTLQDHMSKAQSDINAIGQDTIS